MFHLVVRLFLPCIPHMRRCALWSPFSTTGLKRCHLHKLAPPASILSYRIADASKRGNGISNSIFLHKPILFRRIKYLYRSSNNHSPTTTHHRQHLCKYICINKYILIHYRVDLYRVLQPDTELNTCI